jgi:photosystem II stability/assembly factor-like uncharacterized protein
VTCGYGTAFRSKKDLSDYEPVVLETDFFTDCQALNSTVGFASGYDGGIYKVFSSLNTTQKLIEPNKNLKKRMHFTGLYFKNEQEGWVIGNDGVLLSTTDGKNFKEMETKQDGNFLSITSNHSNELIISTSNGKLVRFAY